MCVYFLKGKNVGFRVEGSKVKLWFLFGGYMTVS